MSYPIIKSMHIPIKAVTEKQNELPIKKNYLSSKNIEQVEKSVGLIQYPNIPIPITKNNKKYAKTKLSNSSLYSKFSKSNSKYSMMNISRTDKSFQTTADDKSSPRAITKVKNSSTKKTLKFCSNKSNLSIINDSINYNKKQEQQVKHQSSSSINIINDQRNNTTNQTFHSDKDYQVIRDDRKFSILDIPSGNIPVVKKLSDKRKKKKIDKQILNKIKGNKLKCLYLFITNNTTPIKLRLLFNTFIPEINSIYTKSNLLNDICRSYYKRFLIIQNILHIHIHDVATENAIKTYFTPSLTTQSNIFLLTKIEEEKVKNLNDQFVISILKALDLLSNGELLKENISISKLK
jgi:hypothetical protein